MTGTGFTRRTAGVVAGLLLAGVAWPTPAAANHVILQQPVWFQWDRATLDILIVPPTHGKILPPPSPTTNPEEYNPLTSSYLAAAEKAMVDWRAAIDQFGPDWLKNGVKLNVYVVGRDTIPVEALRQPEVVYTAAEESSVLWNGAAVNSRPCLVTMSKLRGLSSASVPEFHRVASHELGHCLGLHHLQFQPDTMCSGCPKNVIPPGDPNGPYKCPSNINVETLKGVFANVLGQPGGGQPGRVAIENYQQIVCGAPAS